jgi:hypothetical protein
VIEPPLTDVEVRVLGSLVEKEATTPDNYPLSLNALTAACNQTSNRDPVMSLDESTISATVHHLRGRSLVRPIVHSGGRVTKYEHRMDEALGLVRRQLAVLCVLMLRGPQTAGELRTRTQRIHDFAEVAEVESTLDGLIDREPPLVVRLPRRAGQKEVRYAHLLSGEVAVPDVPETASLGTTTSDAPADDGRVAALERRVETLEAELAALREQFDQFRAQFQ